MLGYGDTTLHCLTVIFKSDTLEIILILLIILLFLLIDSKIQSNLYVHINLENGSVFS